MKRKFVAALFAALTLLAVALPASADTDVPAFGESIIAVEQGNQQHYADVAAQVGNNVSCRAEKPVFVSQPEIDGRVTVRGEDTPRTAVC